MDPRDLSPADFDFSDYPDEAQMEIYRNMTEWERLQMAFEMWESHREMRVGLIREEHPDWLEEDIRKETAKRMLREALTEKELEVLRADGYEI